MAELRKQRALKLKQQEQEELQLQRTHQGTVRLQVKDGIYEGEVKQPGEVGGGLPYAHTPTLVRHGFGTMRYKMGAVYKGEYRDDLMCGKVRY